MAGAFAAWLQGEIDRRGLGVAEAGRALGVSHSMISDYLAGKRLPGRRSLLRIADALGTDLATLTSLVARDEPPGAPAMRAGLPGTPAGVRALAEELARLLRQQEPAALHRVDLPAPPRLVERVDSSCPPLVT
jgi:transcriptional regulator with XRE-family HTH domain